MTWADQTALRAALIRSVTRWPCARCDEIARRLIEQAREAHVERGLPASHPCASEPRR